ncbi:MAG: hypothetical protein LBO69_07360 [Ignavibacteria bacterium]|nr:hypothetical protein [Ignavibacteria bacterium]
MKKYTNDIKLLQTELLKLPKIWEGKKSVLELKEADYNWRQMEWWAFYFEFIVHKILNEKFAFPGDKFDNVCFDLKGNINWDLKVAMLNSDNEFCILNNKNIVDTAISKDGYYGVLLAICDVEWGDLDKTLRKWFYELKIEMFDNKLWKHILNKYYITRVQLNSFVFIVIDKNGLERLSSIASKDKNNQYMINMDIITDFEHYFMEVA